VVDFFFGNISLYVRHVSCIVLLGLGIISSHATAEGDTSTVGIIVGATSTVLEIILFSVIPFRQSDFKLE
jgi:hypothetical protein